MLFRHPAGPSEAVAKEFVLKTRKKSHGKVAKIISKYWERINMIKNITIILLFSSSLVIGQEQEVVEPKEVKEKISLHVPEIERLRLRNNILETEKLDQAIQSAVLKRDNLIKEINLAIDRLYLERNLDKTIIALNLETITFFKLNPEND